MGQSRNMRLEFLIILNELYQCVYMLNLDHERTEWLKQKMWECVSKSHTHEVRSWSRLDYRITSVLEHTPAKEACEKFRWIVFQHYKDLPEPFPVDEATVLAYMCKALFTVWIFAIATDPDSSSSDSLDSIEVAAINLTRAVERVCGNGSIP